MAYQTQRNPIFDTATQDVIERRSKELLGAALAAIGFAIAVIYATYSPDDPGWLSATSGPAQNALGQVGATIASPLAIILGNATWAIALAFVVWGIRFMAHLGEERAFSRAIFVPIAVAVVSIYAATLPPPADWPHTFAMGGIFGDTAAGAILGLTPGTNLALELKILSLISGIAIVLVGGFALGLSMPELKRTGKFVYGGLILTYNWLLTLIGRGAASAARGAARGATGAAEAIRNHSAARREATVPHEEPAFSAPPPLEVNRATQAEPVAQEPEKPGIFARVSGIARRPEPIPEPELVEPGTFEGDVPEGAGSKDRISEKIARALQGRRHDGEPPVSAPNAEPQSPISAAIAGISARAAARADQRKEPPVMRAEEDPLLDEPIPEAEPLTLSAPMMAAPQAPQPLVQHPARKAIPRSTQAKAEAQPALRFDDSLSDFEVPPLGLLTDPATIERHLLSDEALEENARMLEVVLDDYGVKGEIVSVRPGPVVTMYELEPAPGLKASRVIGLADDIARSMSALSARVSTVPGRSVIGIELPNAHREKVVLREILSARDFGDSSMSLPLALGKDIGGDPIVANLAKMPHLLIAGTTGSGKSVAINTMILSLLYRLTPEECRLIMIDPKMLELSVYDGIPHLLSPVVTDPKKAVVALKWVVCEMEERYRKMSKMGVRNIEGYNGRVADTLAKGEMFSRTVQTGFDEDTGEPIFETEEFTPEKLPYIVVVVDEMADLMMVAGKEIEACIQRLAQMARASGIHLIMATQRPSVDVITGTVKANFPTRISFQVTSKIDSRTILGEQGAEQLLGMGDMLYMAGGARITRVHGPFVSDEEVEEIVTYLKSFGPPEYVGGVVEGPDEGKAEGIDAVLGLSTGGNTTGDDALYDQAVAIVAQDRKCSTSYIQRKLGIGYNKAARLVEQMEEAGLVSAANHVGKREILLPEQA